MGKGPDETSVAELIHAIAAGKHPASDYRPDWATLPDRLAAAFEYLLTTSMLELHVKGAKATANDRRSAAVVAGIAQDKLLALAGMPSSYTADIAGYRAQLPELAERFARLKEQVDSAREREAR